MFGTQHKEIEPVINRLGEGVEVNATTVYATYTSGMYNGFYATEAEAISHCESNGADFNGAWYEDRYSVYNPGELCAVAGNESVYASADRSKYLDAIGGRWQMPFVQWTARP